MKATSYIFEREKEKAIKELTFLRRLLNSPKEETIHKFLNKNHGLLKNGLQISGIIISKFKLGSEFIPDFIIFEPGGSARVDTITIVELKDPTTIPFLNDGRFGIKLNQAVNQIDKYKLWIETNKQFFIKQVENKFKIKMNEPLVLSHYNATHRSSFQMKFIIVIGRRKFINETGNEKRIQSNQDSKGLFEITHFDRFVEVLLKQKISILAGDKFDQRLMHKILISKNKVAIKNLASREDIPSFFLMKIASEDIALEELSHNSNSNSFVLDKICLKQPLNVVRHKNCTPEIIEKIFNHFFKKHPLKTFESYFSTTLITIAMHHLTPLKIIEDISNFSDYNYRANTINNKNTSLEILMKLSKDENDYVRERANKRLSGKNIR